MAICSKSTYTQADNVAIVSSGLAQPRAPLLSFPSPLLRVVLRDPVRLAPLVDVQNTADKARVRMPYPDRLPHAPLACTSPRFPSVQRGTTRVGSSVPQPYLLAVGVYMHVYGTVRALQAAGWAADRGRRSARPSVGVSLNTVDLVASWSRTQPLPNAVKLAALRLALH